MNGLYTLKHASRSLGQYLSPPKLAIIGGYHLGNLGDMLLGNSLIEASHKLGIDAGLQTIYKLDKWPKIPHAIIGGGAIGYEYSLKQILKRYSEKPQNIGFLGVDFNETKYPIEIIQFLKDVNFITCRSKSQSLKLQELTGRKDIIYHQDLVFSYKNNHFKNLRETNSIRPPKLFINILPLYGIIKNNEITPNNHYFSENPNVYANFETIQNEYLILTQKVIQKGKEEGYKIETLPFTFQDESMAKLFINDITIKQNKYTINFQRIIKLIEPQDWVFSTRLHATILAMKAGAKITAFAYAEKNSKLINEFNFHENKFYTPEYLLNEDKTEEEIRSIKIPSEDINSTSENVTKIIENNILKLVNGK